MKTIILSIILLSTITASAQRTGTEAKNKTGKGIMRDTLFYPEQRWDTIPVTLVDSKGKQSKALAIFQHGRNIAGKDAPRFVSYLNTSKRRMAAAPGTKIKWDSKN